MHVCEDHGDQLIFSSVESLDGKLNVLKGLFLSVSVFL